MTRARATPPWLRRLLLPLFGLVAIYAALIPLAPGSGAVAPDLLYCLVIAWVIRRPASAPIWAVLGLGLFADLMLSRPLGLGALGLLLASEAVRARANLFRGGPFLLEWLAAVLVFALMLAGIAAVMRLSLADAPALTSLLRHLIATALAYPLVVLALVWGLGFTSPGGAQFGRRAGTRLGRLP